MKRFLLLLTLIIFFFSCNQDSVRGVFQHAHNASEKENSYNQGYLGYQLITDEEPYLFLWRDGDVYAVRSVQNNDLTYSLEYTKVLELTTSGSNYVPISYIDGNFYFAERTRRGGEAYNFYYIPIFDTSDNTLITTADIEGSDRTQIPNTDTIYQFSVSHIDPTYLLFLFKDVNDNESDVYYMKVERSSITTSGLTFDKSFSFPAYADIIGRDALRARTDDPQIDSYPDEVNYFYLVHTATKSILEIDHDISYYYPPIGSDGDYVAFMNGKIYYIDKAYRTIEKASTETLDYSPISFDVNRRYTNYLVIYYEDTPVIGYISNNGVYYREDGSSTPVIKPVSDDADIVPLTFLGKISGDYASMGTGNESQYLLLTQNNGFYVVDPFGINQSRASVYKIDNSSGDVPLSAFFN